MMTKQYDFKGAEAWFVDLLKSRPLGFGYGEDAHLIPSNIIVALRIADRLQRGFVSIDMVKTSNNLDESETCDKVFKAMAEQLIKECKDD